jgi:hypothetical protein
VPETPPLDHERPGRHQSPAPLGVSDQALPPDPLPPGPLPPDPPPGPSRLLTVVAVLVALAVLAAAAVVWVVSGDDEPTPGPAPTASAPPSDDPAAGRGKAVQVLLEDRAQAVLSRDREAFLAQVDPSLTDFATAQRLLVDRLAEVPFAEWEYEVVGEGPALQGDRAVALPQGSAVVRVRLTFRVEGSAAQNDREQYLTVVPRGGRWLLAGDTDAEGQGFTTQRDLWDLGPVRIRQGESSVLLADPREAGPAELRRLSDEADRAVRDVDRVWRGDWSRRPLVILPRSQKDMATLIGSDGKGLAQIAAVTTGSFAEGLTRGDRVVINPTAFGTLGSLGRRIVLSHEMTHLATRATSVQSLPIWLSEGFADYVAYDPTTVPTSVVASDVLDAVRDGDPPRRLPEPADFDAGEGDIAAAYEGAWLACRMIAERFGERALVRFYADMADSAGPGWPAESVDSLGITEKALVREWRGYLADVAAQ